jgi:cytidine deaminase
VAACLSTFTGPYSKFRVGACVLTQSGEYIVGANVENAAYPVGTCAERVAFGTAVVSRGTLSKMQNELLLGSTRSRTKYRSLRITRAGRWTS